MAKRIFLGLVIAAFAAGGAFAQNNISFGVGTFFTSDFGGGFETSNLDEDTGITETTIWRTPSSGVGGMVFVDAFFASISLGIFSSSSRWERSIFDDDPEEAGPPLMSAVIANNGGVTSLTGLEISLMGQLPLAVSQTVTVFPMLGITYRAILAASTIWTDEAGEREQQVHETPGDLSALWLRFGLGMDFSLNERTYLRGTFTYGVRFRNDFERHAINDGASGRLGHGVDVMIGLGFR